jgi:glutathione S-transferase
VYDMANLKKLAPQRAGAPAATRPYMAGEAFTMADISAMAGLSYAGCAGIEIPAGLTHLAAWRERVDARPSVAAGDRLTTQAQRRQWA